MQSIFENVHFANTNPKIRVAISSPPLSFSKLVNFTKRFASFATKRHRLCASNFTSCSEHNTCSRVGPFHCLDQAAPLGSSVQPIGELWMGANNLKNLVGAIA